MPDPRYPSRYPENPNNPRNVNPRDPLGSGGSELNPTRDHVQGEPEGTTPDANEHEPPTPSSPSRPSGPPANERDPYFYDPTLRP